MATLYLMQVGQYLQQPNSGVYQKTMAIFKAFSKKIDVQVVGFGKGEPSHISGVIWNNCEGRNVWQVVEDWTAQHLKQDDRILLRYPFASPNLLTWMKRWGKQVFLEHNTLEENEALLTQVKAWKSMKFKPTRAYLHYTWSTWITKRTDESRFGPLVLAEALGGICVTNEIANYEISRYSNYSTYVLPNGIDKVSNRMDKPVWNGHDIRAVLIIGSFSKWHGVERIFSAIVEKEDAIGSVILDVIGLDDASTFSDDILNSGATVNFLGKMNDFEINQIMHKYHIAIGSLGLHRIGLTEACPLKVREYWANGVPVLLSYEDSACLGDEEMSKWTLKMSADETPVDWTAVREYITSIFQNENWKREILLDANRFLRYENHTDSMQEFLFKKQSS
jgi:hypothetical protein